ncbi:hypothetical protein GCM10023063_42070 [Arthrobacter methylotrophus]|uniref:Uncharacterized protein n=1 Tax=Arthrobacter methylotrophus TaxID=121291 RepID=A0ABV5UQ35_9MICC
MKLESAYKHHPEDGRRQEPDELSEQNNKHRKEADSTRQSRLPDPPDPDNLPIEYPAPREIEWP